MSKQTHKKLLEENKNTLNSFINNFSKAVIKEEASLFVGTGVSMNSSLPSWNELLLPCFSELNISPNDSLSLYKVAQYYANKMGRSSLSKIVEQQVNQDYSGNDVLENLLKLNFRSIWTTNYDHLIEDELRRQKRNPNVIISEEKLPLSEKSESTCVYKINGDFISTETMILTQDEYEHYNDTHALFLTFLKKELVSHTFLFDGYSFEDQIILDCLSSTKQLLSGNGNLHYALIYIDDTVTDAMRYKAQDLRERYNIESVFVDEKNQVDVIKKLISAVNKNKVFISGAYYNVSADEEQFADILSKTLAIRLLEDGKRISTGVGRKLGTYITGYAHQYLAKKSIRNTHRYLSMRPFPFHLDLTDEDKVVYRKLMQHDCSHAIFLFGQSEHEKDSMHSSRGVYQEFCIAQELGLRVIPVGSTGYEAKIIWDEVKGKINEFYYLSKKISILGHETNPQKLTEIILSIINQDK